MYYAIITLLILLDQLIKYVVKTNMDLYESIPLIDGIFHITYIENSGAAFSILQGKTALLTILPAIICLVFLYLIVKGVKSKASACYIWSLVLIFSGGIGNMIDRLVQSTVTDYLDFRIWPVFNLADVCVCVGCGLLLLYVFFIESKSKKNS